MSKPTLTERQDEMKHKRHGGLPLSSLRKTFVLGSLIHFDADQLRLLGRPMVYIFSRGDAVLYIGMSKHGLVRALDPKHHASEARSRATEVTLIPCRTYAIAQRMERELILEYKPLYNSYLLGGKRQRDRRLAED